MQIVNVVTATQVTRQLERLPARERRKVLAYVDSALERREEIEDRKAIEAVRRDPRPPVPWNEVKARTRLPTDETTSLLADPDFTAHLDRMKAGVVRYFDIPVRELSKKQIARWLAQDEAAMAALRATPRKTTR